MREAVGPAAYLASLSDDEPVDRGMLFDGDELVTRPGGPALHVGLGGRVVGEHLQGLTDLHPFEGIAGFEDGHGAEQAHAVKLAIGHEAHDNSAKILTLTRPTGN